MDLGEMYTTEDEAALTRILAKRTALVNVLAADRERMEKQMAANKDSIEALETANQQQCAHIERLTAERDELLAQNGRLQHDATLARSLVPKVAEAPKAAGKPRRKG